MAFEMEPDGQRGGMLSIQLFWSRACAGSAFYHRCRYNSDPGHRRCLLFQQRRRNIHGLNLMSVAIEAHHLSKRFFLGERNQKAFFEDVWGKAVNIFQHLLGSQQAAPLRSSRREFWALRDVSFQVSQGETLAIIGENGAAKSTLLKILSRIPKATIGKAKINGRLASLLWVGTGFHPQFPSPHNIYFNAP